MSLPEPASPLAWRRHHHRVSVQSQSRRGKGYSGAPTSPSSFPRGLGGHFRELRLCISQSKKFLPDPPPTKTEPAVGRRFEKPNRGLARTRRETIALPWKTLRDSISDCRSPLAHARHCPPARNSGSSSTDCRLRGKA